MVTPAPVESLRRICRLIHLQLHKTFNWGVTDTKGIWIETSDSFKGEDVLEINRITLLYGYDIVGWEFEQGKHSVKGVVIIKLKVKK